MAKFFPWDEAEARAKEQTRKGNELTDEQMEWFRQYVLPQIQAQAERQKALDPMYQRMSNWMTNVSTPEGQAYSVPGGSPTGSAPAQGGAIHLGNIKTASDLMAARQQLRDGGTTGTDDELDQMLASNMPAGWLDSVKANTSTSPYSGIGGQGLPPWLQVPEIDPALMAALGETPDWRNPFTAEEMTTLREPYELDMNRNAAQMGSALTGSMMRRGLGDSTMAPLATTGPMAYLAGERSKLGAQALMWGKQRGDQLRAEGIGNLTNREGLKAGRRGEQQQNFGNLWNMYQGGVTNPQGNLGSYESYLGGIGNSYTNAANRYNEQAVNSMNQFGQLVGLGLAQPWKNWKTGGGTSNIGGDYYGSSGGAAAFG